MELTLTENGRYRLAHNNETIVVATSRTIEKVEFGEARGTQAKILKYCTDHSLNYEEALTVVINTFKSIKEAQVVADTTASEDDEEVNNTWIIDLAVNLCAIDGIIFVDKVNYWLKYRDGFYNEISLNDVKFIVSNYFVEHNMKTHHLNNVVDHMMIQSHIAYADLNPDGYLNLNNGILNIQTLTLKPATRNRYFTYKINIDYTSDDLPTPNWDRFCAESIAPNDLESFLNWLTALLHRDRSNEMMLWLYGKPNTGKSLLLTLMQEIFKHSIAGTPLSTLGQSFGLQRLMKVFLNIDADANDGSFGNATVSIFKKLMDAVAVMDVNGKHVEQTTAEWKGFMMAASNKLPSFPSGTTISAILKRVCFVHFPVEHDKNDDFKAAVMGEMSIIFSKLIRRPLQIITNSTCEWIDANQTRYNSYHNDTLRIIEEKYEYMTDVGYTPKTRLDNIYGHVMRTARAEGIVLSKNYKSDVRDELMIMGGVMTTENRSSYFLNIQVND